MQSLIPDFIFLLFFFCDIANVLFLEENSAHSV